MKGKAVSMAHPCHHGPWACRHPLLFLWAFCSMEAAPKAWSNGQKADTGSFWPLSFPWLCEDKKGKRDLLCSTPPSCPLWPASTKMCLIKSWPGVSASSAPCCSDWLLIEDPSSPLAESGWKGRAGQNSRVLLEGKGEIFRALPPTRFLQLWRLWQQGRFRASYTF